MIETLASIGTRWAGLLLGLLAVGGAAAEPEQPTSPVVPAKIWRYAEQCLARCDTDGDGTLAGNEWQQLPEDLAVADANHDGRVTVEELGQHFAAFGRHRKIRLMPTGVGGAVPLPSLLPPGIVGAKRPPTTEETGRSQASDDAPAETEAGAKPDLPQRAGERKYVVRSSRLPPGLPDWFLKRDSDGDGQLTLGEYAASGSTSADKEFASHDRNHDGLITPQEVLAGTGDAKRVKRLPAVDSAPKPKAVEVREDAKEGAKAGDESGAKKEG